MATRDFICTPSEWTEDPVLNGLSDDAELLFRRLASRTDSKWRFAIDPSNVAHSIRTEAFRPQRRFRAWNPGRIDRSLRELTAAGMLTRHYHDDRHWLEVSARYRYVKGRDPIDGTLSGGPDSPSKRPQTELQLGPLNALPPSPGNDDPGGNGLRNELRADRRSRVLHARPDRTGGAAERSETDWSPGQPAGARGGARSKPSAVRQDSGAVARGNDSPPGPVEAFNCARWVEAFPEDPVWAEHCAMMGRPEMEKNGAMWEMRYRAYPAVFETILRDLREGGSKVANRPAYATSLFTVRSKLYPAA